MDILDTFGDWVQLFGFALGYAFLVPFLYGMVTEAKWPTIPFIIILNIILWNSVYDYDIVLGYLVGGVLSAFLNISWYSKSVSGNVFLDPAPTVIHGHQASAITAVITAIVMIAKIVIFW